MAKEIKQKIVLEGEKEYRQALREANRELKTLQTALKAETAELGRNATEQQKAEVKAKSLKAQIAEQKKVVETLKAALAQAKEEYGDNADVVAKWEQQLNKARTALATMENDLEGVGQGLQTVKGSAEAGVVAAHSFAEAFGGMADIGESITSAIEDVFGGVIDTMKAAIGEVWQLVTDTAARANNWTDLANYFGSTAEQVQLMDRAISESAGDFGKFTNLVNQLSFGGKNKKITEWFGISDAKYTNNIDYTLAVLDAMQRAYREWGTGGKWDNAMADIFGGKKSADVSWFVTNLDGIRERMKELQKKGGYLLSEDELETMNEAHVKINTLEDRWDALKRKIAAGLFGNLTLDIVTDVQGALDALARYFDADTPEEREQAIADLKENITELFEAVAGAIRDGIAILEEVSENLKESEDPIVKGIGTILGGIVDALQWFTEDHAKNVVKAMEVIANFWIIGKGLEMGSKIAAIVGNLRTIQLYNMLHGGGTGGASAASSASSAAASAASGAAAAETAGSSTAAAAGGGSVLGGLAGMALILQSSIWAVDRRLNHKEEVLGTDENLERSTGGNTEMVDTFVQWLQAQQEWAKIEDLTVEATEDEMDALNARIKALWDELNQYDEFGSLWDSYRAWQEENGIRSDDWEVPASWWQNPASGGNADTITGSDLNSFRGLSGQLKVAAQAGVAAGVSGLKVSMDGRLVGAVVAPYVSEMIARDLDE